MLTVDNLRKVYKDTDETLYIKRVIVHFCGHYCEKKVKMKNCGMKYPVFSSQELFDQHYIYFVNFSKVVFSWDQEIMARATIGNFLFYLTYSTVLCSMQHQALGTDGRTEEGGPFSLLMEKFKQFILQKLKLNHFSGTHWIQLSKCWRVKTFNPWKCCLYSQLSIYRLRRVDFV